MKLSLAALMLFAPYANLCHVYYSFGTVDCSRAGQLEFNRSDARHFYTPNLTMSGNVYASVNLEVQ